MNVSCPQCSTTYRVDPAKVPPGGVRARCSSCGGVIPVGITETAPRPTPPRPTPPRVVRPFIPSQPPVSAPVSAPVPAAVSVPAFTPPPPPPPSPVVPRAAAQPAPAAASRPTYNAPAPSTPLAPPAPGERRPINPFLARDPSLRAKRLARALVSDMVAYYPAKHSEGLQRGTLKELFREEIKKSYEEYVAQVGADFARGTTLFQEALNEVLGAGKRIF
jgi:predicted Zn finger-like uncharacterized protein